MGVEHKTSFGSISAGEPSVIRRAQLRASENMNGASYLALGIGLLTGDNIRVWTGRWPNDCRTSDGFCAFRGVLITPPPAPRPIAIVWRSGDRRTLAFKLMVASCRGLMRRLLNVDIV